MINHVIKIFYFLYFIFYTISCSKGTNLPLIKDKYTLFYNEWLNVVPIFYKHLFNSNIYQNGDFLTTDKVDIVISNHINRIDSFIISSIIKNNTNKNLYVVMQKEITKIPIIGSFAPAGIVIERNFDLDKNIIVNFLKKIDNGILIILPEGTRMNEDNFKKSQEYSENNNLKKYNNLLYPKTRGLDLIINELNNSNKLGNLIDITLKVKDTLKFKTEYLDFFKYKVGNVYCSVNTYKINSNCYNNYENFKKWFLMIWDKKENYLKNFYNSECKYMRLDYIMNMSTFILNIIFLNIIILNFYNYKSLFKKNNIIIK
jgi:1-acyl-sn-glycerol-3-phosphate acyltransferase